MSETVDTEPAAEVAAEPARQKEHVTLELVSGTDPITRHGHEERDPIIRLRHVLEDLLRHFGFRCVAVKTGQSEDPCPKCKTPLDRLGRCAKCRTGCACVGGGPGRS